MIAKLVMLLACVPPVVIDTDIHGLDPWPVQYVDEIEINTVVNAETGEPRLRQYIFWRYDVDSLRREVCDWRRIEDTDVMRSIPNGVEVGWRSRGRLLRVRAPKLVWTVRDFDLELKERDRLPPCKRDRLLYLR